MIVEMASSTNANRGKELAEESSDTASNVREPTQREMFLAMQRMMEEMAQHRVEMAAQRKGDSGRQAEVTPPSAQPEASSKTAGISMIDKLAKFKKFAPAPFKEAQNPTEAEEWLEELEGTMEVLKTEEEDLIPFTEYLLQGEARIWWKMEKMNHKGAELTWKNFQEIFLRRYFPTSICQRKEREFLYFK